MKPENLGFEYLIEKIIEQRGKQQYMNALYYASELIKILVKEFSDVQKGKR